MSKIFAMYSPKKICAIHALSKSEHNILMQIKRWLKKIGCVPPNHREYCFWFVYDIEDRAVNWEGGWELTTLCHFRNTYSILPNKHLMKNFVPSNLCADLYKCGHPKQLTKSSLCPLWSYEDKPFEFPVRCLADDGEFDNDETCEWLERLS